MFPFIFFPSELNSYVMAGAEAAILRPWGKGKENHKNFNPDIFESPRNNEQLPYSGQALENYSPQTKFVFVYLRGTAQEG